MFYGKYSTAYAKRLNCKKITQENEIWPNQADLTRQKQPGLVKFWGFERILKIKNRPVKKEIEKTGRCETYIYILQRLNYSGQYLLSHCVNAPGRPVSPDIPMSL
ncbi:hypothetical protein THMIRHAT_08170 [Thiosulfativibrio zosterae]|uniref:Uncharacterized protein n=1 Tax=Thiosulfativibrio zosterae TaxID=2675053 RepID=A0A6F8PLS8_9GAMM|nr:hypothetical protein THMIRHAT_08170 [Thiosulfativibrio zosterae]